MVLDAPNIAYYGQNFGDGRFNFNQIDIVLNALKAQVVMVCDRALPPSLPPSYQRSLGNIIWFIHSSPPSFPPSLPPQGKRAFLVIPVKYTNRRIRDHVHREDGQGRGGGGVRALDDEETAMLQVDGKGGNGEGRKGGREGGKEGRIGAIGGNRVASRLI